MSEMAQSGVDEDGVGDDSGDGGVRWCGGDEKDFQGVIRECFLGCSGVAVNDSVSALHTQIVGIEHSHLLCVEISEYLDCRTLPVRGAFEDSPDDGVEGLGIGFEPSLGQTCYSFCHKGTFI